MYSFLIHSLVNNQICIILKPAWTSINTKPSLLYYINESNEIQV